MTDGDETLFYILSGSTMVAVCAFVGNYIVNQILIPVVTSKIPAELFDAGWSTMSYVFK